MKNKYADVTLNNIEKGINNADTMQIGQYAILVAPQSANDGDVVLMTCLGLISINDPHSTWGAGFGVHVKYLLLGEEIKITIK
jgi:hypothetical protein